MVKDNLSFTTKPLAASQTFCDPQRALAVRSPGFNKGQHSNKRSYTKKRSYIDVSLASALAMFVRAHFAPSWRQKWLCFAILR